MKAPTIEPDAQCPPPIEDYMPMLYWKAWRTRCDLEPQDRIQAGYLGLHRAYNKFQPGKSKTFNRYVSYCIRCAILTANHAIGSLVRVPQQAHKSQGWIKTTPVSLDFFADYSDDNDITPLSKDDTPAEAAIKSSDFDALKSAFRRLTPRAANIISLYYGIGTDEPMSFRSIAALLGLSHERVRQIVKQSEERLRQEMQKSLCF